MERNALCVPDDNVRSKSHPMKERLAGAVRHLMQGAAVEKVSNLVNGLVLLRALSIPEYGLLVLIYSAYAMVDFVVGLALGELIVSRCSEARGRSADSDESTVLFRSYVLLTFCTMALVAVAAVIVLNRLGRAGLPPGLSLGLLVVAGATAPVRSLILTELRIRQDFKRVKQVDIVRCCALTTGYLVLIGPVGLGLSGAIMAYTVANALGLLLVARVLVPIAVAAIVRPDLRPVLRLMGEEGKWQTLRYGVTAAHASSRPWLIGAVAGIEAVALFDAAKTATGASLDLLPLKEALVPMMSEQASRRGDLRMLYLDSVRWGVVLFGLMGVAVALAAPAVFTFLFPQYHDAIVVTLVLAAGFLVSGFASPQSALLYALRMQPTYLTTTLLNFGLMFALGIPLMMMWGASGMAMTLIATSALVAILRHKAIRDAVPELRIGWREWFVWRQSDWRLLRSLLSRPSQTVRPPDETLTAADA
jgi:O-antigen/teichoic acid export membrane protein